MTTTYINKTKKVFCTDQLRPLYTQLSWDAKDTIVIKDRYGFFEWECLEDAGYKQVTVIDFFDEIRDKAGQGE